MSANWVGALSAMALEARVLPSHNGTREGNVPVSLFQHTVQTLPLSTAFNGNVGYRT